MREFLQVLGGGLIKLIICIMTGFGVGLLWMGQTARDQPDFWRHPEQGPSFFEGIGAGLLSCAGLLVLLFVIPSWFRKPPLPKVTVKPGPYPLEDNRAHDKERLPSEIQSPINRNL
jgi:hypothetical protein